MKFRVLTSTPLRPLAHEMVSLAGNAKEFRCASAFLNTAAVADVVGVCLESGAAVQVLTGTFGHNTRRATFARLWKLRTRKVETRIWNVDGFGDFHAKVYLWVIKGGRAVAWIGSANMTAGGLQSQGEIILEISGKLSDSPLAQLHRRFNVEWKRASPLSRGFIDKYVEAARQPSDSRKQQYRRRGPKHQAPNGALVTGTVTHHYPEGSKVTERVERKLTGSAKNWVRMSQDSWHAARVGDHVVISDTIANEVTLGNVIDTVKDGHHRVVAYGIAREYRNTKTLRQKLGSVGIALSPKGTLRAARYGADWKKVLRSVA